MQYIPFTDETFHLPYKDVEAIAKDFHDVSLSDYKGEIIVSGTIDLGKGSYFIFATGLSAQEAIDKFNDNLSVVYVPYFKRKYKQ